jgi:hypothetical protein
MAALKQKDLTRIAALALAQAKWGEDGYTETDRVLPIRKNAKPWQVKNFACCVGKAWESKFGGDTWREACEKAGLLASEPA